MIRFSVWSSRFTFVLACHLFLLIGVINCILPENPINCSSQGDTNCTITNSIGEFPGREICRVSKAIYPETEQQIISEVAMASKQTYKVKAATRYSHSQPKLVCPDESQNGSLIINTQNLNRILSIDKSAMTMTVESGVLLRDLISEAAKAGLALPCSPYWWGITVGGMISTGAHGSSIWVGSYFHDNVIGLRIVTPASPDEGYARVKVLDNNHSDLKAAKLSLGVLGIISQVTLQLEPLFKRSITVVREDDSDLATRATTLGKEHEFADIVWYPYQRKALYRLDDRVSSNVSGDGLNDLIGLRSFSIPDIEWARASGFPVLGYQNRLQSSGGCVDSFLGDPTTACIWDSRIKGNFIYNSAISLPISKAKKFIEDLQNGIEIRYIKGSDAYLGTQEDSILFDLVYYRSRSASTPRLFEDIIEEVEQKALFKYGGLPHWGKNCNVGFIGAINKFKHANEFLKVKERYDPSGVLFSSKWTNQILGLDQGGVLLRMVVP
ncbi:hypothetical protein C5167_041724 [Papaver somniferum]|nr:hypothetical protein C5167_041724 [Papaver somniferum]